MKVLIINDRPHQFSLLKGISDNMIKYGICIEIFIHNAGIFYSPSENTSALPFLTIYRKLCKYRYSRFVIRILFCKILIYWLARQYEIIDFQGLFVPEYKDIICKLKMKYNKKIKVTIWGSDFYRQAGGTYKDKEICYKYSDIIQISTQQMKQDFLKVHSRFDNKIRVAHFGLDQLDKLKSMMEQRNYKRTDLFNIPNISDDDIIITCGYNGIPQQQHKKIINAVKDLPQELRDKVYLILPMTYGTKDMYKEEVKKLLETSGLKYYVVENYMNEEQLFTLRILTDIAVNIQTTDAFAGSIQEHLLAKNMLVVGSWLPYHKIFEENNIFVRYTEINNLSSNIRWAVDNYKLYKDELNNNSVAIYNFSSWKVVSEKWADIYREFINP